MKTKQIPLILLIIIACFRIANAATPWLHVDGKYIKDPSGNIVVLRGVALQDITGQKNTPGIGLNGLIDKLTSVADTEAGVPGWYTRVIRFTINPPVTNFETYQKNILKPAVDYATSKGLYVIIDNHFIASVEGNVGYTSNFWNFFAPLYRNYPNVLFELYNEPIDNTTNWAGIKKHFQGWVDIVRKHAPNNLILAGNNLWDQKPGDAAKNPLKGENIMYVSHLYPGHFSNPANKTQVEQAAAIAPVFLSEWGFSQKSTDNLLKGTVTNYGEPIIAWAEKLGLSWTAWVADNDWQPTMFTNNWKLKTGDDEMGGYTKQVLYDLRNDKQPLDIKCVAPYLGFDQTICSNKPLTLSTSLDTIGKTYKWFKNGTLLSDETHPELKSVSGKGIYKVELDSGGCIMKDEISIVDTLFKVEMTPSAVLKDSITLVAGDSLAGYTYKWYRNSIALTNDTLSTLKVFDVCKTIFSVDVSYAGCGTKTGSFEVLCSRGMYLNKPIQVPGIVEAEYYDYQNLPNLTFNDIDPGNNGGAFRNDAVDIEIAKDVSGQYNVGWVETNEWLEYSIAVKDSGICAMSFRIASNTAGGGKLHVNLNGKNVTGSVVIPFTGGWQTWKTVVINDIRFSATDTLLRLYFEAGGFNINYVKIEKGFVQGLDEKNANNLVIIYPNPSIDEINIRGTKDTYHWQLNDIVGKTVLSGEGKNIDMSFINSGQYILFVEGSPHKIIKW